MKPPAFDYLRAGSVAEAVETLAEHGDDARIIAGGQSLVPMLNMRLVRPEVLVDIGRLEETRYIRQANGRVEIGASTTQGEVMDWPDLAAALPLVAKAFPHIGHFQTRNRGTVCGSITHADPSSELPLCLATLGGEVTLTGKAGGRTVAADDFQQGLLTVDKGADEMTVMATFPVAAAGEGYAFREFAHRHGDFAVVAVAAKVSKDGIRLGVGGVADRPEVRDWDLIDGDALDDALNDFAWEMGGSDDIHATARYRRELVRHLGREAVAEARQEAGA